MAPRRAGPRPGRVVSPWRGMAAVAIGAISALVAWSAGLRIITGLAIGLGCGLAIGWAQSAAHPREGS